MASLGVSELVGDPPSGRPDVSMPDDATARAARGTLSLAPQNSAPYLGWPSWFVQDQTFAKRNTDRNRSMLTRPLTQRGGAMSSASTAAASAPPSGLMKRALAVIRGMIDRVFGYDFFISYSWEDEKLGPYAVPLAHALKTRCGRFGFRTCLDRTEYHAGMDLTQATKRRVRASKVFLLVLRPCAARGPWVLRELEEASKARRTIIPIDVGTTFESLPNDLPIRELLKNHLRVRVEEAPGDDSAEVPSAKTLAEIRNAFGFIRRDTIKLSVAVGLVVVFAGLAVFSFQQMLEARQQRDVAIAREQAGRAQYQFTQARLLDEALATAIGAANAGLTKDLDNPALRWAAAITPVRVFSSRYEESIWDVSYCADGKALVAGGADGWLRLLDPQTGKELGNKLGSGKSPVKQVFCVDNRIIEAAQGGGVRAWNRQTGEQAWEVRGSQAAIAVASEAALVAVLSEDEMRLVDITTGRATVRIPAKSTIQASSRAAVSQDGRVLAFTKAPWSVDLYTIAGGQARRLQPVEIEDDGGSVWGLAFDLKSELLAVMAVNEAADSNTRMTVRVYDVKQGVRQLWKSSHRVKKSDADYYPKQVLSFNANGDLLLVGSVDGSARVMDARTGEEVTRVAHADSVSVNDLAWLPDQRYFASAGLDGKVSVWEALSGKEIARVIHAGNVSAIAISPGGNHMASASWDHSLRVSDTTGMPGRGGATLRLDGVGSLSFDASGRYLATKEWGSEGAARLWENYAARAVEVIPAKPPWTRLAIGAADTLVAGIDTDRKLHVCRAADCVRSLGKQAPFLEQVADVRVAASGNSFAVQLDNQVRVFGQDLQQRAVQPGVPENRFDISPKGNYLLYVNKGDLVIYQVATQQEVRRVAYSGSLEFCFDPQERWLGIASSEKDYPLVPLNASGQSVSGELLIRRTIACDPSGKYVATRGKDPELVEVRDTSTGALVKSLRHTDTVMKAVFDTSGTSVATLDSGHNRLIHFWRVAGKAKEGEEIATREATDVFDIAFSPDGEYLAALEHGLIDFHRWKPESLLSEARRRSPASTSAPSARVWPWASVGYKTVILGDVGARKRMGE
jgi:WD40 repeat protein